jgi:hypothetical protein
MTIDYFPHIMFVVEAFNMVISNRLIETHIHQTQYAMLTEVRGRW